MARIQTLNDKILKRRGPKPKLPQHKLNRVVGFRLQDKEYKKLSKIAEIRRVSENDIARELILEFLKEYAN